MNGKTLRIVLLLMAFCLVTPAIPQGFGGLGTEAEGFAVPQPGTNFEFPRDHGAHQDFRIEWWYLTANLKGADGTDYGAQWTLFRSALKPGEGAETGQGWNSPQLWMGHAAVTTPDAHFVAETRARGGVGQAGAETGAEATPFRAWIDDWSLTGRAGTADAYDALTVTASGTEFSYDLSLAAEGPLVFHGDNGYSVKSAQGQASYYYSQPFYTVTGTLDLPDGPVEVTGKAWLDREWSSQPLAADQNGWDWLSLHFDDGTKLMGFQLRQSDGTTYTSGTWIMADGTATALQPGAVEMEPQGTTRVADRDVPTRWRVKVPDTKCRYPRRCDQRRHMDGDQRALLGRAGAYFRQPHRHRLSGNDRLLGGQGLEQPRHRFRAGVRDAVERTFRQIGRPPGLRPRHSCGRIRSLARGLCRFAQAIGFQRPQRPGRVRRSWCGGRPWHHHKR